MPRYRNDSEFGDGLRMPKNRLARQVWLAAVGQRRRMGEVSPSGYNICRILLDLLGSDGRLDLAHETIAQLAACSIATVKRQLRVLRRLGFVSWTRRLIRRAISTEQISNAYVLTLPEASDCTALEQNEREEGSSFNPSSCTPISLKVVRARHQNAKEHKQESARDVLLAESEESKQYCSEIVATYASNKESELEQLRSSQNSNPDKSLGRLYLDKMDQAIEDDISTRGAQDQLDMLARMGINPVPSSIKQLTISVQSVSSSTTGAGRARTFLKSPTSIEPTTPDARASRAYQCPGDRGQSQTSGPLSRSSHAIMSEEQSQHG